MKIDVAPIKKRYQLLGRELNERQRRLWAGAEASALGRGGIAAVAEATGLAVSTVTKGRDEVQAGDTNRAELVRVRRRGAGPKRREDADPRLLATLNSLIEPGTRGDPESPLRWTTKSTRNLAREIGAKHGPISPQKVGRLLAALDYSLQAPSKRLEGTQHVDRNAQFEHINQRAKEFIAQGVPVLSVDSKKKELIGQFKTQGREWQPKKTPVKVHTHDFIDRGEGKAVPYGVYDVAENTGVVNVGTNHDTPRFAVRSLEIWWERIGKERYSDTKELFITADAGGSNSYRSRVWKAELQCLADRLDRTIHVSHFPPGTSKWNKIEHRLFSFITLNWRGRPLSSFESIVKLISTTTTTAGLKVSANLDAEDYPLGETVSDREMKALALRCEAFHGDWNYSLDPRSPEQRETARQPRPKRTRGPAGRHTRWQALQRRIAKSGLSLAEYCRREGLSYDAIRQQRSRLKNNDQAKSRSDE